MTPAATNTPNRDLKMLIIELLLMEKTNSFTYKNYIKENETCLLPISGGLAVPSVGTMDSTDFIEFGWRERSVLGADPVQRWH
jgi:hypothetical protein